MGQLKPPSLTAYEIVLSEEQFENLGRFTAIFSQIDFAMVTVLARAANLPSPRLRALIDGTTAGQRVGMLRKLAKQMPDPNLRLKAEGVCKALTRINDTRNHILHGVWGLWWNFDKDTLKPACAYEKNADNPVHAEQLPELCDRAAKISIQVMELLCALLADGSRWGEPIRFYLGSGPFPNRQPPEWQVPPSRRCAQLNHNADPTK
jgi:hypothetical protein